MYEPTPQPICFFCKLDSGPFPCRTEGELDKARLAEIWLEQHRARHGPNSDAERAEELWWAWKCLNGLTENAPDAALDIILFALQRVRDDREVGALAAGPMEDLIVQNGEAVIKRIEQVAWENREFRGLLFGVWSQGTDKTDVWQRVLRAREGKRPSWLPTKSRRRAKRDKA